MPEGNSFLDLGADQRAYDDVDPTEKFLDALRSRNSGLPAVDSSQPLPKGKNAHTVAGLLQIALQGVDEGRMFLFRSAKSTGILAKKGGVQK